MMARKFAYTIKEAVEVSSLSRTTLYRLERAGDLNFVRVRGRVLVPESELKRLLNATFEDNLS
jgi:excisionase family DNA binding protein